MDKDNSREQTPTDELLKHNHADYRFLTFHKKKEKSFRLLSPICVHFKTKKHVKFLKNAKINICLKRKIND